MPSFFIREIRVVRLIPIRAAAPSSPPTWPLLSVKAWMMVSRCLTCRSEAADLLSRAVSVSLTMRAMSSRPRSTTVALVGAAVAFRSSARGASRTFPHVRMTARSTLASQPHLSILWIRQRLDGRTAEIFPSDLLRLVPTSSAHYMTQQVRLSRPLPGKAVRCSAWERRPVSSCALKIEANSLNPTERKSYGSPFPVVGQFSNWPTTPFPELKNSNLEWKGFYAGRRGLATLLANSTPQAAQGMLRHASLNSTQEFSWKRSPKLQSKQCVSSKPT